MTLASIAIQFLNGLAGAASLFMVAAGLTLIFGVGRIVNFAHGSLYMLGVYIAYSLIAAWGHGYLGFWGGVALAGVIVGAVGAALELSVLRRIYGAPEMLQLLATFAVVLIIQDAALWWWGPEDLLGPRAPGLDGAVIILGRAFPEYDLVLIAIGPLLLAGLWWLLRRTRFGALIRAATQDRAMLAALGVDPAWLFTGVFALGALLAGLGGALQIPRQPAQLSLDLAVIADAFVVVVVGGMGSIPGAYLAALLIAEIKAFCIGIGDVNLFGIVVSFPQLTLVIEFLVMAVVLIARPHGLLGKAQVAVRAPGAAIAAATAQPDIAGRTAIAGGALIVMLALPLFADDYSLVVAIDIAVFALFAASLHFIAGPAGMVSFGHAAYFGLGAYGAALAAVRLGLGLPAALAAGVTLAGLGAAAFGWFSVRLAGIYFAMLTLAFAQIAWSVAFQWDAVTGGSNGVIGVWPPPWLTQRWAFHLLALTLTAAGVAALWRAMDAPFGYALRAGRDSALRCDAIGIDLTRQQWLAFILVGALAGLAGGVYAFSKGSISPESLAIARSVDGLVMMLLGGIESRAGPLLGAAAFTWLQDEIARQTLYWRAALGAAILLIVLAFPHGVVGALRLWRAKANDGGGA